MLPIDLSGTASLNGIKHKKVQQGSTGTMAMLRRHKHRSQHTGYHLYCKPQTRRYPFAFFFLFFFFKNDL